MQRSAEMHIASFAKNGTETVRATLATFGQHRIADLRVYVENDDDELIPTKKGLAVRVEQLPELRRLVDELIAAEAGDERLAA
jgi:hypothetical protein